MYGVYCTILHIPLSRDYPHKIPLMGGTVGDLLGEVSSYSTLATQWEKCNVAFSIKLKHVRLKIYTYVRTSSKSEALFDIS
jgi:hypothetical protein